MKTMTRAVTMSDVAAKAGVSKPTVSHVLNDRREGVYISEDTRVRVKQIALELGYQRNVSARATATGRFGAVALLLSTDMRRSSLPQAVWDGIYDEIAKRDVHMMLFKLPDESLTDSYVLPKVLREWMADGLLIDYTHNIPAALVESLKKNAVPAIWLNIRLQSDAVYPDDWGASEKAGHLLLQAGCKRVVYSAYVGGDRSPRDHYSVYDRREGCASVLDAAGIKLDELVMQGSIFAEQVEAWKQYLIQYRPDGVLTYSGDQAQPLLRAAELLGVSIPDELSLVTFSSQNASTWGQRLTAMVVPERETGERAAQMLLEKIDNPQQALPAESIPFGFHPGETCIIK